MKLTIGPIQRQARFKGDKLAYDHADLLDETGKKLGSVHTNGYAPRWAYNLSNFRWTQPGMAGPFDGAAFDTAELARKRAEQGINDYLAENKS